MKKLDEEYLKKLIKGIDKGNNFADFFLTIGLDNKLIFDEWLYETPLDQLIASERFVPLILSKFPPCDKSTISIDENIIHHCFPNGFNPVESITQPKETAFSLVLDNSYYGIEFPQKYVACLLFYESFESYNKAYLRYKNLTETSNTGEHSSNNLVYQREDSMKKENSSVIMNESNGNLHLLNQKSSNNNSLNCVSVVSSIEGRNSKLSRNQPDSEINADNNGISKSNTVNEIQFCLSKNNIEINTNIMVIPAISINQEENTLIENSNQKPGLPTINHYHSNSFNNKNDPTKETGTENKDRMVMKETTLVNTATTNIPITTIINNKDSRSSNLWVSQNNRSIMNKTNNINRTSKLGNFDDDRFVRLSTTNIRSKFKNYYAPKCICLVSVHPLVSYYIKILLIIYKFVTQNSRIQKPLEKIIDNLIIELPLPTRGLYKVQYTLFNEKIILTQPKMNELPLCAYNFPLIFCLLTVEQIVDIYRYLLLETRIVFFSKSIQYLTPVVHGFIQLLFPLKYSFTFISVLPNNSLNFLESPSPYVIGINKAFEPNFFGNFDMESLSFVVVDLDNTQVYVQYKTDYYKYSPEKKKEYLSREFPDTPEHYKTKLTKKTTKDAQTLLNAVGLSKVFNYSKENLLFREREITSKLNSHQSVLGTNLINTIRDHFFQFLVNILQRYSEFLNLDYYTNNELGQPTINNLFYVNEYLKIKDYASQQFFIKFMETQMFTDFIMKRMVPMDAKDKLEILLFDENMFKKNNRRLFTIKRETPFSDSKVYDYISTNNVNCSSNLNEAEKKSILEIPKDKELELRKSFLLHGQDIIIEFNSNNSNYAGKFFESNSREGGKNKQLSNKHAIVTNRPNKETSSDLEKAEIHFVYYYFPELNIDFFFNNNIRDCFIPITLASDIDSLNSEMVAKSHLSVVKSLNYEMVNNIYICWMQLWAITFWSQDEVEKKLRFQELLEVIDKVYYHEIEVFNLIFEVLFKNNQGLMILKLFERLVHLKLNPTNAIRMIVMRQLDKENINSKNSKNIINFVRENEHKLVPKREDKARFRARSIRFNNDWNVLLDDIMFILEDFCLECHTKINVDECSRDYVHMKKDILWTTCTNPSCRCPLLPKIKVKMGTELNKTNDLDINTSSTETVILYSPSYLKYNYHVGLIKEYLCKLDLVHFKQHYSTLFWDSIWYFALEDLPYNFFIPYQDNSDESTSNNFVIEDLSNLSVTSLKGLFDGKENKLSLGMPHKYSSVSLSTGMDTLPENVKRHKNLYPSIKEHKINSSDKSEFTLVNSHSLEKKGSILSGKTLELHYIKSDNTIVEAVYSREKEESTDGKGSTNKPEGCEGSNNIYSFRNYSVPSADDEKIPGTAKPVISKKAFSKEDWCFIPEELIAGIGDNQQFREPKKFINNDNKIKLEYEEKTAENDFSISFNKSGLVNLNNNENSKPRKENAFSISSRDLRSKITIINEVEDECNQQEHINHEDLQKYFTFNNNNNNTLKVFDSQSKSKFKSTSNKNLQFIPNENENVTIVDANFIGFMNINNISNLNESKFKEQIGSSFIMTECNEVKSFYNQLKNMDRIEEKNDQK